MAFKMNRSMIKGSPAYKKAKAEAKSIVAKAPVGPDAGLVSAAELLGKSKRVPKIDFTIKQPKRKIDWGDLEFGERKPRVKKEKKTKVKKDRLSLKDRLKNIKEDLKTRFDEKKADVLESIYERNQRIAREKQEKQNSTEESIEITDDLGPRADKKDNQEQENVSSSKVDYSRQTLDPKKLDPNTKTKKVEELTKEEINNLSTGDLINYFSTTPSYEADQQETYTIDKSENTLEPRVKVKEREEIKPIDKIKIKQLKTQRLSNGQLFKPGKYTPKNTIDADKNPKYKIKGSSKDIEGSNLSTGGSTMSPGYNLNIIDGKEQWTYNGFPISPSEVNQETYEGVMESAYPEEKYPQEDKNNNSIPDYLERRQIGPSPAQKRDDRIFNGAIKGGKVQQNMLKSGYIPLNKR